MAMTKTEDLPYYAIVGSHGSPTWSETAVAYASFYHLLGKGEYVKEAVNAMRVASGNPTFVVEWAEDSRKSFLEYISTLDTQEAQEQLQRAGLNQGAESLARATELEKGS